MTLELKMKKNLLSKLHSCILAMIFEHILTNYLLLVKIFIVTEQEAKVSEVKANNYFHKCNIQYTKFIH